MLYLSVAALGLNLGAAPAPVASRAAVSMGPIRVAVVGGGPSGACAAEIFAQASQAIPLPRHAHAPQRLWASGQYV
jgi:NADPH-dependent glutamate synthase beta subunit-like oxidoreductase